MNPARPEALYWRGTIVSLEVVTRGGRRVRLEGSLQPDGQVIYEWPRDVASGLFVDEDQLAYELGFRSADEYFDWLEPQLRAGARLAGRAEAGA